MRQCKLFEVDLSKCLIAIIIFSISVMKNA